jgi:succinate dehydrogenase / fumarate reductase flavoprotein subunit
MALDSKFQMVRFRTNGQIIKITLILLILLTNETLMLSLLGLAGGSASATLAELGYNVKSFVSKIHRVARTLLRHKVELTQQNYQGDGDSVFRLFMRP